MRGTAVCDLLTPEKRAISRPGAHVLLSGRLADIASVGVPGDRSCGRDVPGWMVVDLVTLTPRKGS